MGESFVAQDTRDPKTGETFVCKGHLGRGSPTQTEIAAMNKCVGSYEQLGWQKI